MKFILVVFFTLFCGAALVPRRAPAADDNPVSVARDAVRQAVRDHGIQTELPVSISRPAHSEQWWPTSGEGWTIPHDIARILLYVAIGTFILVLVLTIVQNARIGRRRTRRLGEDDNSAATVARMDQAREVAVTAAEAGNYQEAIHTLLLRCFQELRRRENLSLGTSLTSREILARVDLGPEAGAAFRHLVDTVELTWFGGRQPGRGEYELCLRHFECIHQALREGDA